MDAASFALFRRLLDAVLVAGALCVVIVARTIADEHLPLWTAGYPAAVAGSLTLALYACCARSERHDT